ncbi:DUF3429 domain-containing protein [Hyphomicrobiales bacterium BP6-180914]|uniref:DUF3429 domain-containing protein n=2 Tax=Lichenifustis flavocetrariae TaxID=2949735 RepID=A0AA42CP48_9HYPH|nr:DUF3429 domain-containing protein [Lichenifustis flavocetrariae]MCW6510055.1 DUF3429 domain-containing protein [Lichenifustis flavocetrariae]
MANDSPDSVSMLITEPRTVPWLSVVFGFGPMLPFVIGATLAWLDFRPGRNVWFDLVVIWAVSICTFLAGVRRGVSFRTMGGPTRRQMITMLWLFSAGSGALVLWWLGLPSLTLVLLAAAFTSIGILDPIAAQSGEAPLFFARLRPVQMVLPVVSLLSLLPIVQTLK